MRGNTRQLSGDDNSDPAARYSLGTTVSRKASFRCTLLSFFHPQPFIFDSSTFLHRLSVGICRKLKTHFFLIPCQGPLPFDVKNNLCVLAEIGDCIKSVSRANRWAAQALSEKGNGEGLSDVNDIPADRGTADRKSCRSVSLMCRPEYYILGELVTWPKS